MGTVYSCAEKAFNSFSAASGGHMVLERKRFLSRLYSSNGVYELGEEYSTSEDSYRFIDEEGNVVWESKIYMKRGMETNEGDIVSYVYLDCLIPRRIFLENAKAHANGLVNEIEKLASANGVKFSEIKFIGEMPKVIADAIKGVDSAASDCKVLGQQWLHVKLKEKIRNR
jgi:hypothetical protein